MNRLEIANGKVFLNDIEIDSKTEAKEFGETFADLLKYGVQRLRTSKDHCFAVIKEIDFLGFLCEGTFRFQDEHLDSIFLEQQWTLYPREGPEFEENPYRYGDELITMIGNNHRGKLKKNFGETIRKDDRTEIYRAGDIEIESWLSNPDLSYCVTLTLEKNGGEI